MREQQPSTGVARRRRRISDVETEQRMLDAAVAMVNRTGLTVSLEHLSLEDVIRDAGVSRSAVYRRWPYKDLFFSDLLRELARASAPASIPGTEGSFGGVLRVAAERLDWIGTPEGRRALLLEFLRSTQDYETVRQSAEWRTYLALHATFLSLEDGQLRDDVQAALAESERGFISRIAQGHRYLAGLLGYRIRPELDADFDVLATIANANLRGMVLMTPTMPEIAERRFAGDPFGTAAITGPVEWSQPGIVFAGAVLTFVQPDPEVEWDDERIAYVRQAILAGPDQLGED